MKYRLLGFSFLFSLIIVWEIISLSMGRPLYVPSVFHIARSTLDIFSEGWFYSELFMTIWRCLAGLGLAIVVGIPIGLLVGRTKSLRALLSPTIEAFRPLPSAAIIPVAILFLGIDSETNIFVISYGCIWPILINTIDGTISLGRTREQSLKLLGLSRLDELRLVVLPAAMPAVFTGIRISAAIALILAITVELILGRDGLGYVLVDTQRGYRYGQMYGSIAVIAFVGFLANASIDLMRNRIIHWR